MKKIISISDLFENVSVPWGKKIINAIFISGAGYVQYIDGGGSGYVQCTYIDGAGADPKRICSTTAVGQIFAFKNSSNVLEDYVHS